MARNRYYCDGYDRAIDKIKRGSLFEDDVQSVFMQFFGKERFKSMRGTILDKEEGTDFVIDRLRMDSTLAFSHKNNMPFFYDTGLYAGGCQNFKIGIRLGNTHKGYSEFEQPVVVLGIDLPRSLYDANMDDIIGNLRKHADELFKKANEAYLDYTTFAQSKREKLTAQPLRPNPEYRQPQDIGQQYATLNRRQYQLKNEDYELNLE